MGSFQFDTIWHNYFIHVLYLFFISSMHYWINPFFIQHNYFIHLLLDKSILYFLSLSSIMYYKHTAIHLSHHNEFQDCILFLVIIGIKNYEHLCTSLCIDVCFYFSCVNTTNNQAISQGHVYLRNCQTFLEQLYCLTVPPEVKGSSSQFISLATLI